MELCTTNVRRVLEPDARLHAMTGYGRMESGMLYRAFAAGREDVEVGEIGMRSRYERERAGKGPGLAADAYGDCQRCTAHAGRPDRGVRAGQRVRAHPAYVLMLGLVRKCRNNCQDQLGAIFGVDQTAVSRHVRVTDRILATMLPTPHRFMGVLWGVDSRGEFAALFPRGAAADAAPVDGTHVRFDRTRDRDVRDATYSGKKGAYTGNTVLMAMPDGMVIAISSTLQSGAHDTTITGELVGDLGAFAGGVHGEE